MRRAASSIPSNIAEGCGRDGDSELSRFCVMARGSASELEYQILLAQDLELIPLKEYEKLTQQTVRNPSGPLNLKQPNDRQRCPRN